MGPSHNRLPNLIICGVHKAGTTSLFSYLGMHPDICASYKKEIDFFKPLSSGEALPPETEYAGHFSHCGKQSYRLEASPSYLYGKESIAGAIQRQLVNPRTIAILRDPTDRFVSYYSRAVSYSLISDVSSFDEYVSLCLQEFHSGETSQHARNVRDDIYVDYIGSWQQCFGESLRIVFFGHLRSNSGSVVRDICRWLDLDPGMFSPGDSSIENRTLHYRRKALHRRVQNWYVRHETFWRRHYNLKRVLRRFYNIANCASSGSSLEVVDEEGTARLRRPYEPYSLRLSSLLRDRRCMQLPAWLDEAMTGNTRVQP